VDVDYPDIKNSEVLQAIADKLTIPFVVQSASWMDEVSSPWLRTRLILTDKAFQFKEGGEDINLGLDITSSEVGGGHFMVNLMLFQQVCTNGAIATYGNKAYFVYDYSPGVALDIPGLMYAAVDRMGNDVATVAECVREAIASPLDKDGSLKVLKSMQSAGTLNKGVVVKALATLEKGKDIKNLWNLISTITEIAQSYRDELRLRYETVGGAMMGMKFDRRPNTPEEEFGQAMPVLTLPPIHTPKQPAPVGP